MPLSSLQRESKYDVFISFRGADIRDTFLSHLYFVLEMQGVKVFEDTKLERGEKISLGILKAIEESKIALVIFSPNYASSSWCLNELVKIMKCRVKYRRKVIPIFYRVNPEDVRNQTGSYGDAMTEHETQLKSRRNVRKWRKALKKALNISGWDSNNIRTDAKLVMEIVKGIANKLKKEADGFRIDGTSHNCHCNTCCVIM